MSTPHPAAAEVVDPVCGMTIAPEDAVGQVEHKGHSYYFCNDSCLEQFKADPERFLQPSASSSTPAGTDVEYTCPMHPEVRQWGPGSCPICGMALEPVTVSAEEEDNPELADMTRRFWVSTALSVPAVFLAMSEMIPGRAFESIAHSSARGWIELVLTRPVVLW